MTHGTTRPAGPHRQAGPPIHRGVHRRALRRAAILAAVLLSASAGAAPPAQRGRTMPTLTAVPFTRVTIRDRFWAPRRQTNRKVSIPHSLDMLEKAGNVRNFEIAAAGAREGYSGPVFMDSDLYKAIEAASCSLATSRDAALERRLDGIIATIAAAQMPDGYLNTHYQVNEPDRRFTNLRDNHELYCAGHLFEAAVAHYQATGKRTLLDVAIRCADHIDGVFGPGRRMGYPGHPEIELALVKLWRVTGEKRYLDLAHFFVVSRGEGFFAREHGTPPEKYDGAYWQDDVPIREHRQIKGHAVRAGYLLSGVVDLLMQEDDPGLRAMVERVWRNTTERRLYLTGGMGPSAHNEGFTTDYDLPNRTAYQETCASVAVAMWAHRLSLLHGDAAYVDVMERALYNSFLAGVSLDGRLFFYVNPLESAGTHHRAEWFGCACCPPNVARTLAALGGYLYAVSNGSLYVNLYVQGSASTEVAGVPVALEVTTGYPWEGLVKLALKPERPARFALRLRVPGWSRGAVAAINGKSVARPRVEKGYIVLERTWRAGDIVELEIPMPAERIAANPRVKENRGQIALQRGPLVYCLEACDQSTPVRDIAVPAGAVFRPEWRPKLLGGVTVLVGTGAVADPDAWERRLYAPPPLPLPVPVVAVPYCAWDNRAPGAMRVWLPTAPPAEAAAGPEGRAEVSLSFQNGNCQPEGINDGLEPSSSGEQPPALLHWWPHKGGTEWARYTWKRPVAVSGARVYWFDDTGRGECRLPSNWHMEYLDDGAWKSIAASEYPVRKDAWCEISFAAVRTTALRLVVEMQPGWAAGVHEWRVVAPDADPAPPGA